MIVAQLQEAERAERARTERFYCPGLDVVRFLAVIAVFLHHELPRTITQEHNGIAWGHLGPGAKIIFAGTANAFGFGLPLFFTLSAYLIGTLLIRESERYGTIDLRAFYIRRVLRIWPLYFVGLTIGGIFALFIDKRPHDLMLFAAFALMVGNWFSMIWHTSNPMMPLWSISIEEQFYLFSPVTIRHLSRRGLFIFSWLLIALSDVTLYILGQFHADADQTIWYNSFVQFQMFGAGLLLCLWTHHRKLDIPFWGRALALFGGFICWLIASFVFGAKQMAPATSGPSIMAGYTVGAVGCLLIIVALLHAERRWLPRWMIWLGRISFGLYVYHGVAIRVVAFCFNQERGYEHFLLCFISAAGLTVILAALSYRFLELPFLRRKERFEVAYVKEAEPIAGA
jgi:peptidoglycan/LPS O-acetylase OafA/YrhL